MCVYIYTFSHLKRRSLSGESHPGQEVMKLGGNDEFWINLAITQISKPVGTKAKFQGKKKRKKPQKLNKKISQLTID